MHLQLEQLGKIPANPFSSGRADSLRSKCMLGMFSLPLVLMRAGQGSTDICMVAHVPSSLGDLGSNGKHQNLWSFGNLISLGFLFLAGDISHQPAQVQDLLPFAAALEGLFFLLGRMVSGILTLKGSVKCGSLSWAVS